MPSEACCDMGLAYPGWPAKSTVPGGKGPVFETVRPNCVRSAGEMQANCPVGGVPQPMRVFWTGFAVRPSANNVWKIAAELVAGVPLGGPRIETRVLAMVRWPLLLPSTLTTPGIWA